MHCLCPPNDSYLAHLSLIFLEECWFGVLREVKVLRKTTETVKSIVKTNRYDSDWFHRIIADTKEGKHEIDLLYCDRIIFIGIKQGDSGDNGYRKHE